MAKMVRCQADEVDEVLAQHRENWRLVAVVNCPIRQKIEFKNEGHPNGPTCITELALVTEDHFDSRELYFEEVWF